MSDSISRDHPKDLAIPHSLPALLQRLVCLLRDLLEVGGAEAEAFLRDWPRELVARPVVARSLPVVAALRSLSRFAAPQTKALVEAIAALADELDWRQTYTRADFSQRFLNNYGFSEWLGERGPFMSDRVACGVLLLGPDTEYPPHSHEAEELYLPLSGRALWSAGPSDWRLREPGTWIHHPPGRSTPCARAPSLCLPPMSGAPAISARSRASSGEWPTRSSPSDIPRVRSKRS